MSVRSLSTQHDGRVDLWEVDLFGSEQSNGIKSPAAVCKIEHGVPTLVLVHNDDLVSDASSTMGLTLTNKFP